MSHKLTSQQIRNVISELVRTPTVDNHAFLLVTPQSAKALMESKGGTSPSDSINEFFLLALKKQQGFTTRERLWEYWRDLRGVGIEPHVPMVAPTSDGLEIYGLLGFRDTKPVVTMAPEETLYFNLAQSDVKQLVMWVNDNRRWFEIGDIRSKQNISASIEQGRATLHTDIRVRGIIAQDETDGAQPLTRAEMDRYGHVMEKQIQQQVSKVMATLQQRQTDLYGFGRYIFVHHPTTQRLIERQWPEMFADAKVDIHVKVALVDKGVLM